MAEVDRVDIQLSLYTREAMEVIDQKGRQGPVFYGEFSADWSLQAKHHDYHLQSKQKLFTSLKKSFSELTDDRGASWWEDHLKIVFNVKQHRYEYNLETIESHHVFQHLEQNHEAACENNNCC